MAILIECAKKNDKTIEEKMEKFMSLSSDEKKQKIDKVMKCKADAVA